MNTNEISLLPHSPGHLRALIAGADAYQDRFGIPVAPGIREFVTGPEVSAEFLARLSLAEVADPWSDGFGILHLADNVIIGLASFTGPPDMDGVVEIAYGIAPGYQGRGYASEAAQALVEYAFVSGKVGTIRAHTLPQHNASTRVLVKCGFELVGEITDPNDGPVWRWQKRPKITDRALT